MNFLLITKDTGGQANWSFDTDNYPGLRHMSGLKLMEKFDEHLRGYGVEIKLDEDVKEIKKVPSGFEVVTNKGSYQTKTVLICAGKIPKRLNIPGEEKLLGSGVAFCAVCDAPFFKDKTVAVVGGGNSAIDAVFHLENIAKKIYLVCIEQRPICDETLYDKVKKIDKIEILNGAKVTEIIGDETVTGIKIEFNEGKKNIDVDGVFIEVGFVPSTSFVKNLVKLNDFGEIIIDNKSMTSVPGVFSAGDVTDVSGKQIVIAAGEGAKALLSVANYLKRVEE